MFSWGRAEAPEEQRQPTRMLVKLLRRQGILMPTPITLSKESLKLKILIKGIVTCSLPTGKHVRVLCGQSLHHAQLFAAPWSVAHQAPLSMRFSRQEYWNIRILEWVAIFSSRGSSQPRDQAPASGIFYISRQVLYHWEVLYLRRPQAGMARGTWWWTSHSIYFRNLKQNNFWHTQHCKNEREWKLPAPFHRLFSLTLGCF